MLENNQDYIGLYEESAWEKSRLKAFCDRTGISAFIEQYWKKFALLFPLVVFGIYLIFFFQKGISFDGNFYRTEKAESSFSFEGFSGNDTFHILVEKPNSETCHVVYTVNDELKEYKLEISDGEEVTIYSDNLVYYEGYLEKSIFDDSVYLKDKNGEYDSSWFIYISTNMGAPEDLNARQLVNLYLAEEVNRGSCGHPELVFVVVILFIVWLLDIWFPDLFFSLKYYAAVRDPEPSEWYRITQKVGWIIVPFAAIVLLIVSLF